MVFNENKYVEGSGEARELCDGARINLCQSVFQNVNELLSSMMKAKTLLNVEQHFLDFVDQLGIIGTKFMKGKEKIVQKFGTPSLSLELPIAKSASMKTWREESEKEKAVREKAKAEKEMSEKHCLRCAFLLLKSQILSRELKEWKKIANEFEKRLIEKQRYRKQMEDKSQQTEPEPHSKIATTRQVIGIHGGEMELYGFKVSFPRKAVKEDIEFQLSVDNNYLHYPTGRGFPIAPIFGVSPSVTFDVPVDVKVQTWYSAAKGNQQSAQLLSKEDGEDWKEEKEVTVPDTNEVGFKVNHFCSNIIMVSKESCMAGVYYFMNEAYIQRRTGTVASAFYRDHPTRLDAAKEFEDSDYVKAIPNYQIMSGPLNSVFEVKIDGKTPEAVMYTGAENTFKIVTGPDCGLVQIVQYLKDFTVLKSYEGPLILQQSIYLQKDGLSQEEEKAEVKPQTLSVYWPLESQADAKQGESEIVINYKKDNSRIAQNMSNDDSTLLQHGQDSKTTQHIKK